MTRIYLLRVLFIMTLYNSTIKCKCTNAINTNKHKQTNKQVQKT